MSRRRPKEYVWIWCLVKHLKRLGKKPELNFEVYHWVWLGRGRFVIGIYYKDNPEYTYDIDWQNWQSWMKSFKKD